MQLLLLLAVNPAILPWLWLWYCYGIASAFVTASMIVLFCFLTTKDVASRIIAQFRVEMEKRDGIIAQLRLEARALEDRAGMVPTLKLPIFERERVIAEMQAHAEYGDIC